MTHMPNVVKCEHIQCEFAKGNVQPVYHSFMLGLYTRLDVCLECYTYIIGNIIRRECKTVIGAALSASRFITYA